MSSIEHIKTSTKTWLEGEKLFQELTGAIPSTQNQNFRHIDYILGDKLIDVKGLKKSHRNGFILVEFLNVQGKAGWCSKKSSCTHIAFQMPNEFIIVDKMHLRELCLEKCGTYNEADRNLQAKKVGYEKVKYKWIGRKDRKDVFTYILESDLYSLPHQIIKY